LGYNEYPEHPYFFPRLADYFTAKGQYDDVLKLTEQGLKTNADNQLFLLAQSIAQLNAGYYDECLKTSERLIALNDTMPEAYFNIATVHLNRALKLEQENEPRKNHAQLVKLYQDARPYMEAYRKLAPDDKKRWAPALYRIYLNLNMGKRFDEIDRVLKTLNI
jgi:tetratricopeptide (TPR) repeat protein